MKAWTRAYHTDITLDTHTQTHSHNSIGMGDFHFFLLFLSQTVHMLNYVHCTLYYTHLHCKANSPRWRQMDVYERMDVFINYYYIFNSIAWIMSRISILFISDLCVFYFFSLLSSPSSAVSLFLSFSSFFFCRFFIVNLASRCCFFFLRR